MDQYILNPGSFLTTEASIVEKKPWLKDFGVYATASSAGEYVGKKFFNKGLLGSMVGATAGGLINQKRKGQKVSLRRAILGKHIDNWLKRRFK